MPQYLCIFMHVIDSFCVLYSKRWYYICVCLERWIYRGRQILLVHNARHWSRKITRYDLEEKGIPVLLQMTMYIGLGLEGSRSRQHGYNTQLRWAIILEYTVDRGRRVVALPNWQPITSLCPPFFFVWHLSSADNILVLVEHKNTCRYLWGYSQPAQIGDKWSFYY